MAHASAAAISHRRRAGARTIIGDALSWGSYAIRTVMFSASLEVVLTIAYREAVSRRHAYVTLEHLLYALAHDDEGERILAACGVDLPKLRRDLDNFLNESIEQSKRGDEREPTQTAAFRRVLQTAVLHVQS